MKVSISEPQNDEEMAKMASMFDPQDELVIKVVTPEPSEDDVLVVKPSRLSLKMLKNWL